VGIGTTTPLAKLHIRGSQDSSQLIIDANVIQSITHPLIRLRKSNGTKLLDINTDDSVDIFVGVGAGFAGSLAPNLGNVFMGVHSGSANMGEGNTAVGEQSLKYNTSGNANVAVGSQAMATNTEGFGNVAVGQYALFSNTTANDNIGLGANALYSNTTGGSNTAIGDYASFYNQSGGFNIGIGDYALLAGTGGAFNVGIGHQALYRTTNSQFNTALGYDAGSTFDNGYNNVFLGANTDVNGDGYYNVIAIGQQTICTAPSQVVIGNPATTSYRAYANWTNISDGRFKRNIRNNVPGLDFITKLHPVTYNLNATDLETFLHPNTGHGTAVAALSRGGEKASAAYTRALSEKEGQTITGFVAQDVEAAARSIGYNFSGVQAPKNDKDVYTLSYADFVVPLVKAVQEQQELITGMQRQIDQLKEQNRLLLEMIKK
jgi:hypothetical protein